MLLRARVVLPVRRPPIEDGAVCVIGERIAWVGGWPERPSGADAADTHDLGDVILLPGLINAHCHLDYTGMANLLSSPRHFTDWIKAIVALKSSWRVEDFAASWRQGAEMLLRTGTTTVADVEAVPELLPAAWASTPLRVISFRELISLKGRQPALELVERTAAELAQLPGAAPRVGLSPHAPYTTSAALLEAAARAAHRHGWRLTTHLAESEAEFEMFMYAHGPMFDWLKTQRDMSDCGRGSPVQHLERCGYLDENLLAVHGNHLGRRDAALLGQHGVHVVHCPRSHAYFRHLKFPRSELAQAGVNLCLGTDSLASTFKERGAPPELDMFAEMRALAAAAPDLAPERILEMATINGAAALGRPGELGELTEHALADLIAIPFAGRAADACAALTQHTGPVRMSMIGGQWAIRPA